MKTKKQYWKGLEELNNEPEFAKYAEKEFPEYLPINQNNRDAGNEKKGSSRRDFLKMMGFGISAATLAACEAPVRKAIPYLNKPVEVDPGVANYFASTFMNGGDYCSVVVKTREGRPIKVDGNAESSVTLGGSDAQVQASVLSLYDQHRFATPLIGKKKATWGKLDAEVSKALADISAQGGKIALVSKTVLSPSTKATIAKFIEKYPTAEFIQYDPVSASALPVANEKSFGKAVIPSYDFSKADVIVGIGADFHNDWISPIQFTSQYAKTRKIDPAKPKMSRHYQFETNLTLTGSNADYRSPIKASEHGVAVAQLYNAVAKLAGASLVNAPKADIKHVDKAAKDLWKAQGKSLVVSGSNDPEVQVLVNAINSLLSNYGATIDLDKPVNFRQGDDRKMAAFAKDAKNGAYAGIIFLDANPVYDFYAGADVAAGIKKAKLTVSTSDRNDETTDLVKYVAPTLHFLEQWNDAEPVQGHFSISQPTITPIFDSRQSGESLLAWSGNSQPYYDFVRAYWKENIFGLQSDDLLFASFWDKVLYAGVFEPGTGIEPGTYTFAGDVNVAASSVAKTFKPGKWEAALYFSYQLKDGSLANNPLLQELPDPVSKVTWDNYAAISIADAKEFGFSMKEEKTNVVNVTVGGATYELPVVIQPGQKKGTVGIALGYGRKNAGAVAKGTGVNVYPALSSANGYQNKNITSGVKVEPVVDKTYDIARTQTHQTVMGRTNVVQETTFDAYKKDPAAGRESIEVTGLDGKISAGAVTLWKGHKYENHHWGLAIDLTACNGCEACVVSCNVENNIPVVGKQEVINRREMHWLRIDRYYSSVDIPEGTGQIDAYRQMENAAENPEVTFMPMMCQQCNNAPCETVCPVAATTHSSEGLNQMTYNRCIGTRYCANNCPYKVRRFNWFKYFENNEQFPDNLSMNNNLGKMVLNPDVTVRSRGVMEKCTFCVQRIQAGKLKAKKEARGVEDSDVAVACATACSGGALVFGDMNNPESSISKLLKLKRPEDGSFPAPEEPRAYTVLEELRVSPNVYYMTKIRNKDSRNQKA
ncbi:quinol:cytochrome C oxidoreductase [Fulvitalea axinellae]|uniref:Quinol:cytochrome C oxidoreductase n=1 Tax=Fulvitalea axinellae TaxID=1182444 RepID=A0AAU9D3E0_9BACT|nr:quinol:cytochrome C oxidoreductase [Fulvitalea axinellae]